MITVEHVRRHRLRLLGVATIASIVTFAACVGVLRVVIDPDTPGNAARPDQAVTVAAANMLERCDGGIGCLERETAKLVAAVGAVDVVTAVSQIYHDAPETRPGCHIYMHLLGKSLTPRVASGEPPALGERWTECGAGLVHGAFETIPVDTENPESLARIVALCDGPEFAEPLLRHHSCLHAVGHSVHTGVGGDIRRGEELCMNAITADDSFARNHPCLAGLYMVDGDERAKSLPAPSEPSGWAELLSHCTQSPRPEVCVASYFELATVHGEREALAYLDWCLSIGEPGMCLYLLGQWAAFRQMAPAPGEIDVSTCTKAALERGLEQERCLLGAGEALAALGVPREELTGRVCELLEDVRSTCPQE